MSKCPVLVMLKLLNEFKDGQSEPFVIKLAVHILPGSFSRL